MSNFALDVGSSQGDIISSLNYALANLGQGTGTTANLGNVLTANVTTGNITTIGNSTVIGYLYQYMDVAYANTATGGSFSSNSQNKSYFGLRNLTANVWDTNPVDYTWYQLAGGFGTTKSLYYQTTGGRQINFQAATTSPGYYYRTVQDSVPINLDNVSSTQTISTQAVYLDWQYTPATPTGGTYNFGNLYLTAPTGWSANIPNASPGNVIYISENTFSSSQNFIVPPNGAWTFPVIFSANGAAGANGLPAISTYYFPAYTTGNVIPTTPIGGSWDFGNVSGTPPHDPFDYLIPYQYIKPSTITVTAGNTNVISLANLNLGNTYINYNYYTVYANTYNPGPNTSYAVGSAIYGGKYITDFTVSQNTAYVDLLLVGAGGAGSAGEEGYDPYIFEVCAASGGNVCIVSNIALPVGAYRIVHGPGCDTVLLKNDNSISYTATQGTSGHVNRAANVAAGYGGGLNGGARTPGTPYPLGTVDNTGNYQGGYGVADPWNQITWAGNIAGNGVAYFGGGGSAGKTLPAVYAGPYPATPGGLGGGGAGQGITSSTTYSFAVSGQFSTGGGGGGGAATNGNFGQPPINNFQGTLGYSIYDTFSVGGVAVIRQHNPLPANLVINTWSTTPISTASNILYSCYSVPSVAGNVGNVTSLTWTTPVQFSGNTGANGAPGTNGNVGSRGFIPMAYVVTASDPTSYTDAQYTYAFTANRANISPPIGTGYSPIDGDVAQFVYPSTNVLTVKTFQTNTSPQWQAVNGQVISGNVFVTGSINASALNANDVYALNIASTSANVGNVTSPGFWLQASSGDARFAGNTNIGNSLIVGANAQIGGNLNVGTNATIGSNLTVGNNTSIGANLSVGTNANIGANAIIGGNLTVGSNANIGGNLNVVGLITAGNLQSNTVSTTTMQINSVTTTSGFTTPGYFDSSPNSSMSYAGFDGTYYIYLTSNIVPISTNTIITTANVVNVISGFMDVSGYTNFGSYTGIPQIYGEILRYVNGSFSGVVNNTTVFTPAYNAFTGLALTTQTQLAYRLNEVAIVDAGTVTPPAYIQYYWAYGAYLSMTSNHQPSQPNITVSSYGMTSTNYKR